MKMRKKRKEGGRVEVKNLRAEKRQGKVSSGWERRRIGMSENPNAAFFATEPIEMGGVTRGFNGSVHSAFEWLKVRERTERWRMGNEKDRVRDTNIEQCNGKI